MTVQEAIDRADAARANTFSPDKKIEWLNQIDRQIFEDVFKTHEDPPEEPFTPYTKNDMSAVLLVPDLYAELYEYYLCMQIDVANAEMLKYQNSAALYNNTLQAFYNWYNRTHMPLQGTVLNLHLR